MSRITDLFCKEMKHAWENVLELDLSIDRVESNPQLVQIVPPNEVVVLISFELTLGDARGMMNLCIPFNSIERISTRLSANSWVSYGKKTATPENIQRISSQLSDAVVEVVVDLAETNISTSDLIGLRVGDIIATEKDVERPLVVSVEGRPKFHAQPGAFKGRKAIQVVGPDQFLVHDASAGFSDVGGDFARRQSLARLRPASAPPARSARRRPTALGRSARKTGRAASKNFGQRHLHQCPSAHRVHEHGRHAGDQPNQRIAPRAPQPNGHAQQRECGQQLIGRAEQGPKRSPGGIGLPAASTLVRITKNSGTPAVRPVPSQRPTQLCRPVSS